MGIAAAVKGQTCSCYCGSYSYYSGTACSSSSSSCASTCYSRYSNCLSSNTLGCCGSQSCAYYSSYYSYNQCNCQCSSTSGGTALLVGSATMSGCNDTLCKEACNSLHPTTCGVYSNQAYCTNDTVHHGSNIYVFIINMMIVCLIQNINKLF